MKNLQLSQLLLFLLLVSAHAQTMTNEPSDNTSNSQSPPPPALRGPMAGLSQSERAQVKSAHDLAIQQDPSLEQKMQAARQAMDEARKEMHDAMIKADPSVEPILAKMMPPKWGGHIGPGTPEAVKGTNSAMPFQNGKSLGKESNLGRMDRGLANLSESERRRVISLHEQVKNDPEVIASREDLKNAMTPESRQEAQKKYREVMRDAMIKMDPSIEPILEKMHPGEAAQSTGLVPSSIQ
jgi:hypothetical protein